METGSRSDERPVSRVGPTGNGGGPARRLSAGLVADLDATERHLRLVSAQPFATGVLYLVYAPDPSPPTGSYDEAKESLPQD